MVEINIINIKKYKFNCKNNLDKKNVFSKNIQTNNII